jgi:hypothetical protein
VRAGRPAEAAADLRRALELWARDRSPNLETHFERSRVLAQLAGLGSEAKSGVSAAEARVFADQAVAALRDAVQVGWARPGELKEADFDALRRRDDFQKLLAELKIKGAGAGKDPVERESTRLYCAAVNGALTPRAQTDALGRHWYYPLPADTLREW